MSHPPASTSQAKTKQKQTKTKTNEQKTQITKPKPKKINLQSEKVYFGAQFWRFHSY